MRPKSRSSAKTSISGVSSSSGKEECPLDRQGRILISPSLRDYAQLSRDLILVGMTNWFEIWDRGVYEAH